jgi:hypothetical protein
MSTRTPLSLLTCLLLLAVLGNAASKVYVQAEVVYTNGVVDAWLVCNYSSNEINCNQIEQAPKAS